MKDLSRNSEYSVGCELGQTMTEYAIALAVISGSIIVTIGLLSSSVSSMLADIAGRA